VAVVALVSHHDVSRPGPVITLEEKGAFGKPHGVTNWPVLLRRHLFKYPGSQHISGFQVRATVQLFPSGSDRPPTHDPTRLIGSLAVQDLRWRANHSCSSLEPRATSAPT
jgi:hypothetical protein